MKYKNIALFCGSAEGNNPDYALKAREFGIRLAERISRSTMVAAASD